MVSGSNLLQFVLLVTLLTACSHGLPRAHVRPALSQYARALQQQCRAPERPRHFGHRAGAPERYPTSLDDFEDAAPDDITTLIDLAFEQAGLDGVEIDVQVGSDEAVYIVHDPPDWERLSKGAWDYLRRNRLRTVLRHVVDRGYLDAKKQIAIELKSSPCAPSGRRPEAHALLAGRVLSALKEGLAGRSDASNVLLISFNPWLLEAAHKEALHRSIPGLDFILIAGSNRPYCGLGCWFSEVPCLDESIITFVEERSWLTGLWLSPIFTDLHQVLPRIANRRPLRIGLATYLSSPESFRGEVKAACSVGPVHDLIHDIVE